MCDAVLEIGQEEGMERKYGSLLDQVDMAWNGMAVHANCHCIPCDNMCQSTNISCCSSYIAS